MAAKGASIRELVADALSNLYALRLRSALALLGIVIGAGSVIAMLTIGHMAEREALRVFSRMGLQTLVATATLPNPAAPGFDRGDIEALSRRVAAVAESAPITIASVAVDVDGASQAVNVAAATPALKALAGLEVRDGRFIGQGDGDNLVVVLGAEAPAKLSRPGAPLGVGRSLRLGLYLYSIIGILRETETTVFDPTDFNNAVIIPLSGSARALGRLPITGAMVRVRPGADVDAAAAIVANALKRANPNVRLQVQTARQLVTAISAQKAVHTKLLAAVGAISLLVGGIGVMNVMLMGVMERRREIGLRAAIGARPRDLQLMFLVEAGVLALGGGVVGTFLGLAAAYVVARSSGWAFSVPAYAAPLGIGMAAGVGLVFGLYPAIKASQLDPIEALRAD